MRKSVQALGSTSNYFLSPSPFCYVIGWSKSKFRHEVINLIKHNKDRILNRNKYLGFLVDRLKQSDVNKNLLCGIDASELLPELLKTARKKRTSFIKAYIKRVKKSGQLQQLFPLDLIREISVGPPL
ncbi:MAG: hypothetical protein ISR65_20605 [Bacteriovoracaceae bacterium]|nr:hypothetical protein [Bacteriovoracaceae bacterium]